VAGTIKVPGLGQVPKTQALVAGGVAAGIVAFAWWRASTGKVTVAEPGVDPVGLNGDTAGGGSFVNPNPTGAVPDPSVDSAPTTNEQWSQRVSEALAFSFDATLIQTTIGKYLDRQPLTTTEQLLVRTAWGFVGRPPVGTFPIIPATTTAPTVPGNPGTPTKPPTVKKPTAAMATIPAGGSMYSVMKMAHPGMNAAQANNQALLSINLNRKNGINPWGSRPGFTVTQMKLSKATRVYIL
jgi:hypothetical protein